MYDSSPELGISISECFYIVIVQAIKTLLTIPKKHAFTMPQMEPLLNLETLSRLGNTVLS